MGVFVVAEEVGMNDRHTAGNIHLYMDPHQFPQDDAGNDPGKNEFQLQERVPAAEDAFHHVEDGKTYFNQG